MQSMDWRRLATVSGTALERLPLFANVLLILALAYLLAQLTWRLVPGPVAETPPAATVSVATTTVPRNTPRRDIAGLHLFGEISREAPPPVDVPIAAPDTQLRLSLLGVSASKDPSSAWAIIADASGNEETYGIDASLPGGAILKEIHPDRVILMRNNRFETLRLPQDTVNTDEGPRGGVTRSASVNTYTPRPRGGTVAVTPEVSQALRGYRDALLNDPQSVMDVVRAEPYRQGGNLMGYRIFPGRDKEILRQLGLRPGDVVTAVNGVSLDNPIKGLEIMRDLSSASQVSVDVMRNGVAQTFVVPIQ